MWITTPETPGLDRCLRQATARFADWARSQGRAQEELVTGRLLTELEVAFREAPLRLESGGRHAPAQTISVSQRSTSKVEEKVWQCDVALLLDVDIRPSVSLRLAELVQLKKPAASTGKRPNVAADKWRIDVPQLGGLLRASQSSSYWLLTTAGEVLCVTARWIHGLVKGRDALGKGSVTVGYNDVRHTAVALEQFLLELFLGTWVGDTREGVLDFALSENGDIPARHIFQVAVVGGRDQG